MRGWVLGFLVLTLAAAEADDSTAMLSLGSIVFTKNTPLRMAAEDLFISPRLVRIRFEFENPTSADIETMVAFPLPDLDTAEFYETGIGTVTEDPANFVGFRAAVDGRPVAVATEQHALLHGRDVSDRLRALGVPLNPAVGGGYQVLQQLAGDKKRALIAAGLGESEGDEIRPLWLVRTRFYWTQRFAAHRTVVIEHSYQPVTGQSFFSTQYQQRTEPFDGIDYCIDPPTWAAIESRIARSRTEPQSGSLMMSYQTAYILSTAGNWQGPIGRFHLTLDKLRPDNILSLCWEGALNRTGPTTFEFNQGNFSPRHDIHLLVLEPMAPAP